MHSKHLDEVAGSCCLEQLRSKVLSFVSGRYDFSSCFHVFDPQMKGLRDELGGHFGVIRMPMPDFKIPVH